MFSIRFKIHFVNWNSDKYRYVYRKPLLIALGGKWKLDFFIPRVLICWA